MDALKYGTHESDSDDDCFQEQSVRQATTFRPLDAFETPTRRSDASEARTTSVSKAFPFLTSPALQDVSPAAPAATEGTASQASQKPKVPPTTNASPPQGEEVPKPHEPPEAAEEKVLKRPARQNANKASDSQEGGGSSSKAKGNGKSSAKTSKTPGTEDNGGKKEEAKNGGDGQGDEGVLSKGKAKASAKARVKGIKLVAPPRQRQRQRGQMAPSRQPRARLNGHCRSLRLREHMERANKQEWHPPTGLPQSQHQQQLCMPDRTHWQVMMHCQKPCS